MSVFQSKFRVTSLTPARLTEWTSRRPRRTPTASSTGRVMRASTSSGAVSGKSVWMVMLG